MKLVGFAGLRGVIEFANFAGDEYHYLYECSYFEEQRRLFLSRDLSRRPNMAIYERVTNSKDISRLFKLGKFCKTIVSTFKKIHSN